MSPIRIHEAAVAKSVKNVVSTMRMAHASGRADYPGELLLLISRSVQAPWWGDIPLYYGVAWRDGKVPEHVIEKSPNTGR